LQSVAFITLYERHLLGSRQIRLGPTKALLDGIKLLKKEQILPLFTSDLVFLLVPGLSFVLMYLDFLSLEYSLLFFLCLLGFRVYSVIISGYISKSKYGMIGALRARSQRVSYEIAFSIYLLSVMFVLGLLMFKEGFELLMLFMYFPFLIILIAELNRAPFDFAEGERELVRGYNVEFGRVAFVLLFLREYGGLIFFCVLYSVLFFGFSLLMVYFMFSLMIFVRRSYPRYRYDLMMKMRINQVFLLDVFLLVFLLQYVFYFEEGILSGFFKNFLFVLSNVFSYGLNYSMSYMISFFTFIVLLLFCFGGYFSYSFCVCGMLEFTLFKSGDKFLKTFRILIVEVVRELSRPMALTIRLTVNVMVGHLIVGFLYIRIEGVLGDGYVWLIVLAIMVECFVFFIQSYIFSRLIYLYRRIFNYFVLQESLGLIFLLLYFGGFLPMLIMIVKIGVAPFHFWLFKVIEGMFVYFLLIGLLVCLFQLFVLKSFKKLLLVSTVESFRWVVLGSSGFSWELVLVFMNIPFRVGFFVKIILLMEFLKSFGIYMIVIMFLMVKNLLFRKYSVVGMIYSFPLIIVLLTGLFLSFYYVADGLVAFSSVQYVIFDVNLGWLFRIFHFNGASLFFIFLYLHIFKGLFMLSVEKSLRYGFIDFFVDYDRGFYGLCFSLGSNKILSCGDPEMFVEADPMMSPVHIVPEWYFLFAYAILRAIPNKVMGVVALLIRILLFYFFLLVSNYTSCLVNLNNFYIYCGFCNVKLIRSVFGRISLLCFEFGSICFFNTNSIVCMLNLGFKGIICVLYHNFHILRLSSITSSLVLFFKFGLYLPFLLRLLVLLFISFLWGKDISLEGLRGYHNFFVMGGFKFGVMLFIFMFFDSALVPVHELGGD
uniref:Cytochrome b n=1 Tax=Angiostrongylus cantonensis TaxID=6313 RepID=A0A0K0DRN4_ANGCA